MQIALPGLLSGAAQTVVERPWASLGRGLVFMLLVPGFAALLMATLVGAPIGMVMMAAFVVLLAMSFVAISFNVGLFIRGWFGKKDIPSGLGARLLWTTIGILVLIFVCLIPFIGWAFNFLAMVAGLGAVTTQLGPLFRRSDGLPAPA